MIRLNNRKVVRATRMRTYLTSESTCQRNQRSFVSNSVICSYTRRNIDRAWHKSSFKQVFNRSSEYALKSCY